MTREIRRSLVQHSALRRDPHAVLRRALDRVTPGTRPEEPIAELERRLADLLGKPAALFFPTGTMAQQTALRVHAERTGRRTFAAHPQCHLVVWEDEGYHAVHGLRHKAVGDRHELITLDDLAEVREPLAALLLELPQREIGGLLPTWDDLVAQTAWARDRRGDAPGRRPAVGGADPLRPAVRRDRRPVRHRLRLPLQEPRRRARRGPGG
jgi:hypothetical protein